MMKGGLAGLMKQAQVMQDNMKKVQDQLAQTEVEGRSAEYVVPAGDVSAFFAKLPKDAT